jgi:hypothetical protein
MGVQGMNSYKKYMIGVVGLTLVCSLTACGKKTPAASGTQPAASGLEQVSIPADSASAETPAGVLKGTGTYEGQGDTTSVEITMEGQPVVFQLGHVDPAILDKLSTGDKVDFQYTEQKVQGDSGVKERTLTRLQQAGSPESGSGSVKLSEDANLSYVLGGTQQQRPAKLVRTDNYALYVPEGYSFDKASSKLTLDAHPDYFATITPLPEGYKLEYLKFEADEEMSDVGRVKEIKGADIVESMRDAELVMVGNGSVRKKQYIVKKFGTQGYVFRLDIPIGEPADEFLPLVYASLNSLVNLK